MVHDVVWSEAGADAVRYLCVGCLEHRLGRALVPADFRPLPVNVPSPLDTPRLAALLAQALTEGADA